MTNDTSGFVESSDLRGVVGEDLVVLLDECFADLEG